MRTGVEGVLVGAVDGRAGQAEQERVRQRVAHLAAQIACFLEWLLRSKDVSIRKGNRVTTWPLPLPDQIDPPELGEEFKDLFARNAEVARNAHSAWDEFSLDTILTSLHMPGLNMALALSLRDWCEYRRTFDPGMWRPDLEAAAELFIVNPGAHPGREVDFARQA